MTTSIQGSYGTLSVDQYIEQIMALEKKQTDTLNEQKSDLNNKISIYSDFSASLKSLQDKIHGYSSVGSLNTLIVNNAVSSAPAILSANVSAGAGSGSYLINIDQLAKRDMAYSDRFKTGGSDLAENESIDFTIQAGGGENVKISVKVEENDSNRDVLEKISNAVNKLDAGVSAGVIDDTKTTSRLTISSDNEGSDNKLILADINGGSILSELGFINNKGERTKIAGTNGGFIETDTANLNAIITLNGITIERQSNSIDDLIDGVSINVNSMPDNSDTALTLTIEKNKEDIKSEIESFIEEYNEIVRFIRKKTSVDTATYTRGELYGDSSISMLKGQLTNIIFTSSGTDDDATLKTLAEMGISIQRNGELEVSDSSKFDEAAEKNIRDVVSIFAGDNGIAGNLEEVLKNYTKTGGIVNSKEKSIQYRIKSIDDRLKREEQRLQVREEALRKEYAALQKALNLLNSQQSTINSSQSIYNNYLSYF